MIIDKFAKFTDFIISAIGSILPADIIVWLSALIVIILVLAAWRLIS